MKSSFGGVSMAIGKCEYELVSDGQISAIDRLRMFNAITFAWKDGKSSVRASCLAAACFRFEMRKMKFAARATLKMLRLYIVLHQLANFLHQAVTTAIYGPLDVSHAMITYLVSLSILIIELLLRKN